MRKVNSVRMTYFVTAQDSKDMKRRIEVIRKAAKEINASKESAVAFLQRAGIVDKSGKKLAKRYR